MILHLRLDLREDLRLDAAVWPLIERHLYALKADELHLLLRLLLLEMNVLLVGPKLLLLHLHLPFDLPHLHRCLPVLVTSYQPLLLHILLLQINLTHLDHIAIYLAAVDLLLVGRVWNLVHRGLVLQLTSELIVDLDSRSLIAPRHHLFPRLIVLDHLCANNIWQLYPLFDSLNFIK